MCKIKTCGFCLELLQFMPSCYCGNNVTCHLYSVVEILWILWRLMFFKVLFWYLGQFLVSALVFASFFHHSCA